MRIDSTLKRARGLAHSKAGIFNWFACSMAACGLAFAAYWVWAPASSAMDEPDRPRLKVSQSERGEQLDDSFAARRDLIEQYCVDCHDSEEKTAGLDLGSINLEQVSRHLEVWENVVRKLRTCHHNYCRSLGKSFVMLYQF